MTEVIAADAEPLIAAFRAGGGLSFDLLGVEESRARYERSCAANGTPRVELLHVRDAVAAGVGVRIYSPDDAPPASTIVFLHGGGWVFGSLDTHDTLCRRLAATTGATVVSVAYRLAPEHPYPAALEDARAVLTAVLDGSALGLKPGRVAIVGDSVGGGLTAILAVEARSSPLLERSQIAAQVLLYPVTDLTMTSPSYRRVTKGLPLVASTMRWFVDLYAGPDADLTSPELSPAFSAQPSEPIDAFVCTVGLDPLADEGIRYAGLLAEAGATVEHHHLPRHAHGLFTSAGAVATGARMLDTVADFLRVRLTADGRFPAH